MQTITPQPQSLQISSTDLSEFKHIILTENVYRLMVIAGLGILFNLLAIVINSQTLGWLHSVTWIRIIWAVVGVLYLIGVGKPGRRPYGYQKGVVLGGAAMSLFCSAILSGLVNAPSGAPLAFIINILVTSAFLFLPFWEILAIIGPSIIYLGALTYSALSAGITTNLSSSINNIMAVTIFSIMLAHLLYRARRQRFMYEKMILQHNEFLKNLAGHDGLTGVDNRRKIDESIAAIQTLAAREQISVAVLMVDLDNFKSYNDTYGHLAGDELLKAAAAAMKGTLQRATDAFGRYGGEEFISILPATDTEGAALIGDKMRLAILNLTIPHAGTAAGVATISCGVAADIPSQELSIADIIHRADQALYRAKHMGKNRVERQ